MYEELHWYERPLKTCPICGKQFSPASEHAWLIGSEYTYDTSRECRNIPVCTYSCMRKWEKDQEEKCETKSRFKYSEETLHKLCDILEEPEDRDLVRLYFWDRLTVKEVSLKIGESIRVTTKKIHKLKDLINELEEQQ